MAEKGSLSTKEKGGIDPFENNLNDHALNYTHVKLTHMSS